MDKPIRYESIQEPLDDEERELEVVRIERTARAQGMSMHEFVQQAARDRLPQDVRS